MTSVTPKTTTGRGHTPGPWEPRQNESVMYVTCVNELHVDSDGDPTDICSIDNESYYGAEQAWANCRLIAAATELLEALHSVDTLLSSMSGTPDTDEALRIIAAAIAKAAS